MTESVGSAPLAQGSTGIHACKSESHWVGRALPEETPPGLREACREAELAAGNVGVDVIKVGDADRPPGALAEDLQGAGGEAVDIDPAHQPDCALLPCI